MQDCGQNPKAEASIEAISLQSSEAMKPENDGACVEQPNITGNSSNKEPNNYRRFRNWLNLVSRHTDEGDQDPLAKLAAGYPRLSGRMGHFPPMAMFRRFGALNARNLLYLQSELQHIEDDLIELENKNKNGEEGMKSKYSVDHYWLKTASAARDGDTEQIDLVERMKKTLNEFNHALIQQATILQLPIPEEDDIRHLQNFFASEKMRQCLIGPDEDTWGSVLKRDGYSKELVALKGRDDVDKFSHYLAPKFNRIINFFMCGLPRKKDPDTGLVCVNDSTIFTTTFWITGIVAALAPVLSIVILTTVGDLKGRLGVIAGFNVLVSVLLTFLTDAKRTDIFAVTAFYTVVQIVFVGVILGNGIQEVYCVPKPS